MPTSQQDADEMLRLDRVRRATMPEVRASYAFGEPRAHDMFCRCRACKPPYDAVPRRPSRVVVSLTVLTFVVLAVLALA